MFPLAFSQIMERLLGAEYDQFLAAADLPRHVGLRLNPLKHCQTPDLSQYGLAPVPWAVDGHYYNPDTRPGLSAYHEAGLYYLQEASAMAPVGLLDVQPGQNVLDLCAAPGGKTTQIAAQMDGRGLLVCNEINGKRATILSRNVERMAVANSLVLNEHPAKLASRFPQFFHRILVDAPCSGEGMFRKEEAAVTDWSLETVEMCANRQQQVLASAATMLAPGGRLVYSTCTFSPQENEGVIASFLAEHPDFSLVAVDTPWFQPGHPEWADGNPDLVHTKRLWPHKLKGEGHFAAVLQRSGSGGDLLPPAPSVKEPPELTEFLQATGLELPQGNLVSFGKNLCIAPENLPDIRGLKVLRVGLELGQVLKNRFQPAHALALWATTAKSIADFPVDSPEIAAYLRGETVAGSQTGWTLLTVDGLSLGWVKGSGGVLKNHLPKGLRRMA